MTGPAGSPIGVNFIAGPGQERRRLPYVQSRNVAEGKQSQEDNREKLLAVDFLNLLSIVFIEVFSGHQKSGKAHHAHRGKGQQQE